MSTSAIENRKIELSPIRLHCEETLKELQTVVQTEEVTNAIAQLNTCLDAVRRVCGPDMLIPVIPK